MEVNESVDSAKLMEEKFLKKFNELGKYEQMSVSLHQQVNGWPKAFELLESL